MTAAERLAYLRRRGSRSSRPTAPTTSRRRGSSRSVGRAHAEGLHDEREGVLAADRSPDPARVALARPPRGAPGGRRGEAQPVRPPPRARRARRGVGPVPATRCARSPTPGSSARCSCSIRPGSSRSATTATSSRRCASAWATCRSASSSGRRRWLAARDRDRTLDLLRDLSWRWWCVDTPKAVEAPDRARGDDRRPRGRALPRARRRHMGRAHGERRRAVPVPATRSGSSGRGSRSSRSSPSQAREVHALMNNCYQDYGVRNAAELRAMLAESARVRPSCPRPRAGRRRGTGDPDGTSRPGRDRGARAARRRRRPASDRRPGRRGSARRLRRAPRHGTRWGLPHFVGRATTTAPSCLRQPFVRRSWTRVGMPAVCSRPVAGRGPVPRTSVSSRSPRWVN